MILKQAHFKAIFFLTMGWFGVEMAGALDSVQFQRLLGDYHLDAKAIGAILCLGPAIGIFQPLIGYASDMLCNRGMKRRTLLLISAGTLIISIVSLAFTWNLFSLILAIIFFYISLNLVIVNYRALIGEVGSRQALSFFRGTITGFMGLFSALGGLTMYLLNSLSANSTGPFIGVITVLIGIFSLLHFFLPKSKLHTQSFLVPDTHSSQTKQLVSPLNLLFYVAPIISLFPRIESTIAPQDYKKAIFRLFCVVFMLWFGIGAMRYFFFLFATRQLHIPVTQASLPFCLFTLTMILVSVPIGKMADRVDNRIVLRCTAALYLLAALCGYFFVNDLTGCLVLMGLLGIGFAGNMSMPITILFRLCPPRSEGTYLGLYNMFICIPQVYSLLMTGWLVDTFADYRLILLVAGGAMLGALFFSFLLLPISQAHVVPLKPLPNAALEA